MATKDDLATFRSEIKNEIKVAVSEAVDPVKDELIDIQARLTQVEKFQKFVSAAEGTEISSASPIIFQMQKEIDELRNKKSEPKLEQLIAVFGGFKNFDNFDKAKEWIYEKLWKEWLPTAYAEIPQRRMD